MPKCRMRRNVTWQMQRTERAVSAGWMDAAMASKPVEGRVGGACQKPTRPNAVPGWGLPAGAGTGSSPANCVRAWGNCNPVPVYVFLEGPSRKEVGQVCVEGVCRPG